MKANSYYRLPGIIGGLGPMASVYFYEMITEHTLAKCDQDHIDLLLTSRATTPDRTAYILGQSDESPLPVMISEAKRLISAGADVIVIPCNTAHYFYDGLCEAISVPVINIMVETVKYCVGKGMKKAGILATEGTVRSRTYERVCNEYGVEAAYPCDASQKLINEIIYGDIKQGRPADMEKFGRVAYELREQSCDTLILGCTELSLVKRNGHLGRFYTDSLEVLADVTIRSCGKTSIGFDL